MLSQAILSGPTLILFLSSCLGSTLHSHNGRGPREFQAMSAETTPQTCNYCFLGFSNHVAADTHAGLARSDQHRHYDDSPAVTKTGGRQPSSYGSVAPSPLKIGDTYEVSAPAPTVP
jgi:hypothetical protein